MVQEWVRSTIEKTANEYVLGSLSIGSLSGDLLKNITLTDIHISHDAPVLSIDTLKISYNIRALFARNLVITELAVINPNVFLEMQDDSLWNVQKLLPEAEETETEGTLPFNIILQEIGLSGGNISIIAGFLPDDILKIQQIEMQSSASLIGDETTFSLSMLSFEVLEGRLPEPISIRTKANLNQGKITLEDLLVDTGRTLLQSNAFFNSKTDSLYLSLGLDPLNRKDISAYLDELPEFEKATLTMTTQGFLSNTHLSLDLIAENTIHLTTDVRFSIEPEPLLTSLDISVKHFNPKAFPQLEEISPHLTLGQIRFSLDGEVPLSNPFDADIYGSLVAEHVYWDHIQSQKIEGKIILKNRKADLGIDVFFPGQDIRFSGSIADITKDSHELDWNGRLQFNQLNAAYFADNSELESKLSGVVTISGLGIEPGLKPWFAQLRMNNPDFNGYTLEQLTLNSTIDASQLKADVNLGKLQNEITANLNIRQWNKNMPEWSFEAALNAINLEQIANLEGIDSRLNVTFDGSGSGVDPETMNAQFNAEVLPSLFLGQRIDEALFQAQIEQGFLNVREGIFRSRFVDANLNAFQRLGDFSDPKNNLDYTIELKNMEAFATLLNVDSLSVSGIITGEMRYDDQQLRFNNRLNFSNLIFDELHIQKMDGSLDLAFNEVTQAQLKITLNEPGYGELELKNISFDVFAILDERITGNTVLIVLGDEDTLTHESEFTLEDGDFHLRTTDLYLRDPEFDLFLTEPFSLFLKGDAVSMDTLRMESSGIAEINLNFSRNEVGDIHLFMDSNALNLSALERSILKSSQISGFFDLFADLSLSADGTLRLNSVLNVDSLLYGGIDMDALKLAIAIDEERLESELEIIRNRQKILESRFNLPFVAASPLTLDDSFFERSLSGFLRLTPQTLMDYEALLEWLGFENISGVIQADMTLQGTAGRPDFDFSMLFKDGNLSGVPIDSLVFGLKYNHDDERLHLNSMMHSLGQQAFTAVGSLPFLMDWRTFSIAEDALEGDLVCDVNVNQFDLAALNVFIDRDIARNLRGRTSSSIQIRGNIQQPEISGNLNITDAQVFLVENNITLRNIRMQAELRPNVFELTQLYAESVGDIRVNGTVQLDGFRPERFDIQTRANRFRISHTRDMEILIGLNGAFTGTPERPRLTGEILLDRGFVYLDNFGESPVEVVVLEEDDEVSNLPQIFYDRLELEMSVRADGRFFLRNRNRPELNLELQGAIDAVKEPGGELELFGDMGAIRGYANQLGRRFVLDEGQILFSGPATNPELSIRLKYELRREDDITIWYVITGDVENPIFAYESEPEMELQDTISYIIFGRPFNALSGWQQGVSGGASAGNVVADAALDLLIERLESLAADRLGIDVLEIDNSGDNSGTTIKAGKYFGDRLFVALLQELSSDPTSKVIIEYLLRRNLELIFTGSDDYRTGVDIRWRLDY